MENKWLHKKTGRAVVRVGRGGGEGAGSSRWGGWAGGWLVSTAVVLKYHGSHVRPTAPAPQHVRRIGNAI